MSKRRPATEAKLQGLAHELYRRRGDGVIVPLAQVKLQGWRPKEQACHANVDTWVLSTDASLAVRGWLFIERGARGFPTFVPHSVVETAEGNLIDVTPTRAVLRYPFIRDLGRPGEFGWLIARHKLEFLDYRRA